VKTSLLMLALLLAACGFHRDIGSVSACGDDEDAGEEL
jgi:outer membrane lipopolysaccharide assembly protein LptE/RlpB